MRKIYSYIALSVIFILVSCNKNNSSNDIQADTTSTTMNTGIDSNSLVKPNTDSSQTGAIQVSGDTAICASGLRFIDTEKGKGKRIEVGMKLKIDYAGFLTNGKVFDTSIESVAKKNNFNRHGMPFTPYDVTIGTGGVIKGWDEGLTTNMYVGGTRRLFIPPSLGYGESGFGSVIPPNSDLIFDVTVLSAE